MRRSLVVAFLLLAACSGDGGGVAAVDDRPAEGVATDDVAERVAEAWTGDLEGFYVPPDPLPAGEPGDLLRWEEVDAGVAGARAWRVLYLSESVQGDPIAVSGLVAAPAGSDRDRPVLSWAHGTTGLADACTPSKDPTSIDLAAPFLTEGWVVAATDYEGLGTPGLHPYVAGVSEGRGTLDAVKAARQLPTGAGTTTVLWGHSQGGHAALFAHQLAEVWAPELDVVGTVAGAPATELPLIAVALRDSPYQGYLAMAAAGLNAAHPEAALDLVLTDDAIARLAVMEEGCTAQVFAAFDGLDYDEVAKAEPTDVPVWREVLEANDPGHVRVDVPLLIIHGEADEQIPVVASQLLFERLCGLGQVVERRTYPGIGHAEVIGPSFDAMFDWMRARVAGEPAATGCPQTG
jgi:fermentation-respiration switch protein FrsA (DUF1100 family)